MASELLQVFLNSTKVGVLLRDGAQLSFKYDAKYLATQLPLPLSRHLPLKPGAFTDDDTRAFFANLLPEGVIRTQIARQVGVSAENVMAFWKQLVAIVPVQFQYGHLIMPTNYAKS